MHESHGIERSLFPVNYPQGSQPLKISSRKTQNQKMNIFFKKKLLFPVLQLFSDYELWLSRGARILTEKPAILYNV